MKSIRINLKMRISCVALMVAMLFMLIALSGCASGVSAEIHDNGSVERDVDGATLITSGGDSGGENDDGANTVCAGNETDIMSDDAGDAAGQVDADNVTDPGTDPGSSDSSDMTADADAGTGEEDEPDDANRKVDEDPSVDKAEEVNVSSMENIADNGSTDAGEERSDIGDMSSVEKEDNAEVDNKPEPLTCTYCKKAGHDVSDCAQKAADEAPCSYCKKTGHKIDTCSVKKADETPCAYCKQTGHKVDACAVKAADEAPCSYCKAADHKVDDCKQKKADEFDVGYWVQYAKDYAVSIGLTLDPTMSKETSCWDNPIVAKYSSKYLERNIQSRMNEYKRYVEVYGIAGIVWVEALPDGPYEWDLMVYYA